MPKFRTNKGRLTAYSFACGYIEQKSTRPSPETFRTHDLYTELYREGIVYHVRQFDRRPDAKQFQVFWKTFSTLGDSVAFFNAQPGFLVNVINGIPVIGAGPSLARQER